MKPSSLNVARVLPVGCEVRSENARRGSVLILVIVVLVLLALLGTAYITTSRADRNASQQNVSQTQLDVVLRGLSDTVNGTIASDLNLTTGGVNYYRGMPPSTFSAATDTAYLNYTGFARLPNPGVPVTGQLWLAARTPVVETALASVSGVPVLGNNTTTSRVTGGQARPYWEHITRLSTSVRPFVDPTLDPQYTQDARGKNTYTSDSFPDVGVANPPLNTGDSSPPFIFTLNRMYPTFKTWNGVNYPAFFVTGATGISNANTVVAADADGDGVADSGLQHYGTIPSPEYAGLTFYYGVRVIDNNSAVNLNTAMTSRQDFDFRSTPNSLTGPAVVRNNRLFPAAINLEGLLVQDDPAKATTFYQDQLGLSAPMANAATESGFAPQAARQASGTYFQLTSNTVQSKAFSWGVNSAPNRPTWPYQLDDIRTLTPDTGAVNDRGGGAYIQAEELGSTTLPPSTASGYVPETFQQLMSQQLARRLDLPGFTYDGTATATPAATYRAAALTPGDGAQLASRFCLVDQNTGFSPRSQAERMYPYSLYRTFTSPDRTKSAFYHAAAWNTPYAPSGPIQTDFDNAIGKALNLDGNQISAIPINWFAHNFDYLRIASGTSAALPGPYNPAPDPITDAKATPYLSINNLRPLAVTRNPVSNAAPNPTGALPSIATAAGMKSQYQWVSTRRYQPGDVVVDSANGAFVFRGSPVGSASTATLQPSTDKYDVVSRPNGTWIAASRVPQSTRTDVNQADFGDLWRAFFLTMCGAPENGKFVPFYQDPATTGFNPGSNIYLGNYFAAGPGYVPDTPIQSIGGQLINYHPYRMFRSSLRDTRTSGARNYFDGDAMVLLRSALAAVNAQALRESLLNVDKLTGAGSQTVTTTPRQIIKLRKSGTSTPLVDVEVFGQQPDRVFYISEVYVNTNAAPNRDADGSDPAKVSTNTGGYIAIELYNPGALDIDLANCKIVQYTRGSAAATQDLSTAAARAADFGTTYGTYVIPAGGYLLLENYGTAEATYRPMGSGLPRTGPIPTQPGLDKRNVASIPLKSLINSGTTEAVIVRPLTSKVTTVAAIPTVQFVIPSAPPVALSFMPVDAIDLTGVQLTGAATAKVFYYSRAVGAVTGTFNRKGYTAYPGRYSATDSSGAAITFHQQGIVQLNVAGNSWTPNTASPTAADLNIGQDYDPTLLQYRDPSGTVTQVFPTLGGGGSALSGAAGSTADRNAWVSSGGTPTPNASQNATYPRIFPIQIGNHIAPSDTRTAVNSNEDKAYPVGGFMREGDLLQVPYIGAYVVRTAGTTGLASVIDLNPVTMDAAMAEDTDVNDDSEENIGRFCPMAVPLLATGTTPQVFGSGLENGSVTIDEFPTFGIDSTSVVNIRYGWSTKLLDFLTTRSPQAARNIPAPRGYNLSVSAVDGTTVVLGRQLESSPAVLTPDGLSKAPTNTGTQETVGIDGLVNINTAPLPVLASVPWVRSNDTVDDVRRNTAIAQAIINYRNSDRGPFRSIFQLNEVPGLATELTASFRTNTIAAGTAALPYAKWGTEPANGLAGIYKDPQTQYCFLLDTTQFKTADNGHFAVVPQGTTTVASRLTDPDQIPGPTVGSVIQAPASFDNVPNDFTSQYLMMTAVSNLITTRSDTFTVYIVLEGWRNVGTATATREVQKRTAYQVDRNSVVAPSEVPFNITTRLKLTPVPEK